MRKGKGSRNKEQRQSRGPCIQSEKFLEVWTLEDVDNEDGCGVGELVGDLPDDTTGRAVLFNDLQCKK